MSAKVGLLWVGLLVLAVVLRVRGIDHFLPYLIEPDPSVVVQVDLMESGAEQRNEYSDWGAYPHVLARATQIFTAPMPRPALDAPIEEHVRYSSDTVLRVRWVGALISVLAVLATLLLAGSILPPGWALVAGGFMATSLLALHFGAQARPHATACGLFALALVAAVRLPQRPTVASYVLLAVLAGLALGSLQSAVALGPALLVAHILAMRGQRARRHLLALIPLAGLALALLLFWPFLLEPAATGPGAGATVEQGLLQQGGHKVMLGLFNGGGFPILGEALLGWEPALLAGASLAVAVGLVGLLRRRALPRMPRPAALVMLAYALPYGLVIGLYQRSYERFLLPLVPLLAVLTAWGLWRLAAEGPRARRTAIALAALLLAVSGGLGLRLVVLRERPTTLELASDWVLARTTPDSPRLWLIRPLLLPALQTKEAEADDHLDRPGGIRPFGWVYYRRHVLGEHEGPRLPMAFLPIGRRLVYLREELPRDPGAYMQRLAGGERVLAEVYTGGRRMAQLSILTRQLRERFPLEARFEPGDGCEHPLAYQDNVTVKAPLMALRLLRAERLGPVIESYALDPPLR